MIIKQKYLDLTAVASPQMMSQSCKWEAFKYKNYRYQMIYLSVLKIEKLRDYGQSTLKYSKYSKYPKPGQTEPSINSMKLVAPTLLTGSLTSG